MKFKILLQKLFLLPAGRAYCELWWQWPEPHPPSVLISPAPLLLHTDPAAQGIKKSAITDAFDSPAHIPKVSLPIYPCLCCGSAFFSRDWRAQLQNCPKKWLRGGWVSSCPQKSVLHMLPVAIRSSFCQNTRAGTRTLEQHVLMDVKTFPTSLVLPFLLRNKWRSKARLLLSMTWSRTKLSTQRHSSHLTHQLWHIQFCAQHKLRFVWNPLGQETHKLALGGSGCLKSCSESWYLFLKWSN